MRAWWERTREEILVSVVVIPEITYLLQSRIGTQAELAFVRSLAAGDFILEPIEDEDLSRAANLMEVYGDLPLGFVDGVIAATAERLAAVSLLTTDRRHFSVIRPGHVSAFRLLP